MFESTDKLAFTAFFGSELFKRVQLSNLFEDSKTFSDAIAKSDITGILANYDNTKNSVDFDLKHFVKANFKLPENVELTSTHRAEHVDVQIRHLWDLLHKQADAPANDSLIALPNDYTVPGGRFREVYYWDSYFAAVGLLSSGRRDMVESLLDNFIYLQQTVGLVPNGNRWYYSGRSQPPILALLVALLSETGDVTPAQYAEYLTAVENEYGFWMTSAEGLQPNQQAKRVCKMPCGSVLNRYYDNDDGPRPESYTEDVELKEALKDQISSDFFRDIRAACESGWDFSSRWLKREDLGSIRTTQVIPVDLNALLYFTEAFLERVYSGFGDSDKAKFYGGAAAKRQIALNQYCWNETKGVFVDYWVDEGQQSQVVSLATAWPMFVSLASASQASRIAEALRFDFLKPGGLVTTEVNSGQQWDSPNGWAPLQWVAVKGLHKYGEVQLATECACRWLKTVNDTYLECGKFMEKYNVLSPSVQASGGEYKVQEGFGWTNGVTLGLVDYLIEQAPAALERLSLSNSKLNGLET